MRSRRYQIVSIVLIVMLGGFVALTACSNYGEGERCEVLNNNDDCADGLQCLPKTQINPGYNNADRCCPPDRTTATHPACTILQNVSGDAAAPLDTGPPVEAAAGDAAETGTSTEAGTDAADAGDSG